MAKQLTLPFRLLQDGSTFTIHSEPSRGITRSDDKRTYLKVCMAYSVECEPGSSTPVDPEHAIILRPNDLVVPKSRPRHHN